MKNSLKCVAAGLALLATQSVMANPDWQTEVCEKTAINVYGKPVANASYCGSKMEQNTLVMKRLVAAAKNSDATFNLAWENLGLDQQTWLINNACNLVMSNKQGKGKEYTTNSCVKFLNLKTEDSYNIRHGAKRVADELASFLQIKDSNVATQRTRLVAVFEGREMALQGGFSQIQIEALNLALPQLPKTSKPSKSKPSVHTLR